MRIFTDELSQNIDYTLSIFSSFCILKPWTIIAEI